MTKRWITALLALCLHAASQAGTGLGGWAASPPNGCAHGAARPDGPPCAGWYPLNAAPVHPATGPT